MVEAAPKKSRWKGLLQNLALMAGTFFLCVAVFEIALRLKGYGNLEIYEPDPVLYWKLKPNQDCYTKVDHKPVHINSQGTRGPEFQPNKPADTIRILSLGDSRTFGWGLTEQETYSKQLEQLLQQYVGGKRKVEVINAGVNAWSYPQMLAYLREVGSKYQPDYVILAEANLWTQFSDKNDPEFVRKFMSRVRLKNFLRRFAIYHYIVEVKLQAFYQANRAKFIPVDPKQDVLFKEQQQKDPDAVFRSAIEDVCALALSKGEKPFLLYLPPQGDLERGEQKVLKTKQAAAAKLNVPVVDLTPALRAAAREKTLYLDADPIHFSTEGNRIIARELFAAMTNSITP